MTKFLIIHTNERAGANELRFFAVGHGCGRDFRRDADFVFISLEPRQSWFRYENVSVSCRWMFCKRHKVLLKPPLLSLPAQGHPSRSSLIHSKLAREQRIVASDVHPADHSEVFVSSDSTIVANLVI